MIYLKKKLLTALLVVGFILGGVTVAYAAPKEEVVISVADPGGGGH
jgi:hypothetical protein